MAPLALALHLALAAPGPGGSLVPPLDPGPFGAAEMAGASLGSLLGDVAVLAAGYGTLQLFANGAIEPTSTNFRRAAYVLAGSALVVPPLVAVLLADWARARPASGSAWKALLLATIGQALALGAGVVAAPQLWMTIPFQLLAVPVGATVGLHWGPRPADPRTRAPGPTAERPRPREPGRAPAPVLGFASPVCPDA